jgi:DNA repair protein RecO (recombination protein O)
MYWQDEGFLLSKNNFDENSIIIEAFTSRHGRYTGIVYGGSSRKQKRNFQIGNKILFNWRSKNEDKSGYFNIELIKPIAPLFFDDKKKSVCILAATSILKILLPERQINEKIYNSFELMLNNLISENWIQFYIHWELSLIKELGFEIDFLNAKDSKKKFSNSIEINGKSFKIPEMIIDKTIKKNSNNEIREALIFNKNLLVENFISPNRLKFPLFRNILEDYYT